jgi:hypothetical protein
LTVTRNATQLAPPRFDPKKQAVERLSSRRFAAGLPSQAKCPQLPFGAGGRATGFQERADAVDWLGTGALCPVDRRGLDPLGEHDEMTVQRSFMFENPRPNSALSFLAEPMLE